MIRKKILPEIVQKEICGFCGGMRSLLCHDEEKASYDHDYYPVRETLTEAAYRQGYEAGYEKATDRAHWGQGWD